MRSSTNARAGGDAKRRRRMWRRTRQQLLRWLLMMMLSLLWMIADCLAPVDSTLDPSPTNRVVVARAFVE